MTDRTVLHEAIEALEGVLPYLEECDWDKGVDDESVGWHGDGTDIPLTFGQIRACRRVLARLRAVAERKPVYAPIWSTSIVPEGDKMVPLYDLRVEESDD